jgi:hypothetical protein
MSPARLAHGCSWGGALLLTPCFLALPLAFLSLLPPHLLAFIVLLLPHPHAFVVLLLAILVPILLPILQSLIVSLPAHANLLLGRLISLRAFRWRLSTFYPRRETGTRDRSRTGAMQDAGCELPRTHTVPVY